jgi:hypothetical protein
MTGRGAAGDGSSWLFGYELNLLFPNPVPFAPFTAPSLARDAAMSYDTSAADNYGGGASGRNWAVVSPVASPGLPPTGTLTVPAIGTVGVAVPISFVGSDPEGGPIAWDMWTSYVNGSNGWCCFTGTSVNVTFNAEGVYRVAVQAIDRELNQSIPYTAVIIIGAVPAAQPPIAVATLSAQSGTVPFTVNIDMSGSSDSDGLISSYYIGCGGGFTAGSSGATGSCNFTEPGTYWLLLQVRDNTNRMALTSKYVVAKPLPAGPPPSPPGAFDKSSPANGGSGVSLSPTLSWGASTNATSYQYCFDTTNDSDCSGTWTSVTSTSAALSGLVPGTTYYWHVRANNASGTTYSNVPPSLGTWWSFATSPAPAAFSKTAPANGATGLSTTPTLSWAASTNATSYEYCYDSTNDNACAGTWTNAGASTSAGLSGLAAGATYYWQVRAVGVGGTTYANAGTWWSLTTAISAPPGAYNKTSPTNGAGGQAKSVKLTWTVSTGATGYEYCVDTSNNNSCDSGASGAWTAVGNVTSVQKSGLSGKTTYYWHVRAIKAGEMTYSNVPPSPLGTWWSFTTR